MRLRLLAWPLGILACTFAPPSALAAATDSLGEDLPPTVNVVEPLNHSVAQPDLHFTVECSDDDPAGCSAIRIRTGPCDDGIGTQELYFGSGATASVTISFAGLGGSPLVCIFGIDSQNQSTGVDRQVYVEVSRLVLEVEALPGLVLDFDPDRALWVDESSGHQVAKVRQRATGVDELAMDEPGRLMAYGYLTPTGAIFAWFVDTSLSYRVADWNNGVLWDLGHPNSSQSLQAAGDYAIWNTSVSPDFSGRMLYRRHLPTATNLLIAADAGNTWNSLAANGDVTYAAGAVAPDYQSQIFRFANGVSEPLTDHPTLVATEPASDELHAVYQQGSYGFPGTWGLYLHDPEGDIELLAPSERELSKFWDYRTRGGWVAFTGPGLVTEPQVYLRSPSGATSQISFSSSRCLLDSLSPHGAVTFVTSSHHFLSWPGLPQPIDLGSWQGLSSRTQWWDHRVYRSIGRSIFVADVGLPLFLDGFESGDLSAWTAVVGGARR